MIIVTAVRKLRPMNVIFLLDECRSERLSIYILWEYPLRLYVYICAVADSGPGLPMLHAARVIDRKSNGKSSKQWNIKTLISIVVELSCVISQDPSVILDPPLFVRKQIIHYCVECF